MKSCMMSFTGAAAVQTAVLRPPAPIESLGMSRDEQPVQKLDTGARKTVKISDLVRKLLGPCEESIDLPDDFVRKLSDTLMPCEESIDLPDDWAEDGEEQPIQKWGETVSEAWFRIPQFKKIWDEMPGHTKLLMPCEESIDLPDDMGDGDMEQNMDPNGPIVRQWSQEDTDAWLSSPKNKKVWDELPGFFKALMPCEE